MKKVEYKASILNKQVKPILHKLSFNLFIHFIYTYHKLMHFHKKNKIKRKMVSF